jgi:hypothetical protein
LKVKTRRNPDQGIKYIQIINKNLQDNFEKFFSQVRVYYKPFFSKRDNCSSYIILKLNKKEDTILKSLCNEISRHAIETIVYPSVDFEKSGEVMLFVVSSFQEVYECFKIAKKYNSSFEYILEDKKEIWKVWNRDYMKFKYWEVFDPKEKKWIFETEKYLKNIKEFEKN